MKKFFIILIFLSLSVVSSWSGEFEDTLKKAEQGDAIAQFSLGCIYEKAQGVTQDCKQAIYWYKKAAERGHVDAQTHLGKMYNNNILKGFSFKNSSTEKNCYSRQNPDVKKAMYWYKKAAEQGGASAQNELAEIYYRGIGEAAKDYKKAAYWYKKAAEQGHNRAQENLADMYYKGRGIQKQNKLSWLKKLAEQEDTSAMICLSEMYFDGHGVKQDYNKAVYWCKKVAEQGNVGCQNEIAGIYYRGLGEVARNYDEAAYWYKKAAEQGHIRAQENLAYMYAEGIGVTQDYNKAAHWCKKGIYQTQEALYIFARMYEYGKGIAIKDKKKSIFWYKKAAEQGHVDAQVHLGDVYFYGQGVTKDYNQAVYWYKKAAIQGNNTAQINLGFAYNNGQGVTQNFKLAYVWANLAAAQGNERATNNRDIYAKKLSPQELTKAQEFAAKIQHTIDHPNKSQEHQPSITKKEKQINGSGTGFIITKDGYIITCHHVIADASKIRIPVGGTLYEAKLICDDPNNDLALLKINGSFSAISFSSKRSAKMGQEVFTIGYPNPLLQGKSAKFTKGTISSLTGFQDDLRLYQISVPVQPGNSGGALVDENGNILGIIVAMLSAKTTFKISGTLPQNVNYAVKSIYAQAMLDSLPGIAKKLIAPAKGKPNVVKRVKESTVMILSYE